MNLCSVPFLEFYFQLSCTHEFMQNAIIVVVYTYVVLGVSLKKNPEILC